MHMGSWTLSLLGPPQLQSPEGRAVPAAGKPLALLALLALEGSVTRARLADLLWPGVPESTARNNLVNLLRRWRQGLGEDLWVAGDRLALRPDLQVDVHALLASHGAPDDALYCTGPLLDGVAWPELLELSGWLLAWRERLDAQRARLALEAAGRHEAAGRFGPALEAARAALAWNPVSEEAHRAVMRAAYLGGDRNRALRAYDTCRTELRDRLKVEPLPVTQALAALIQRGGTLPAVPVPAPPPRPPLHAGVLVGREREWAQMERAWAAGQAILLVGEAGAGKSRLAAEFVASRGDALWLTGRPGDRTVPYATAVRNLRRVLAQTGPGVLTAGERASLARLLPELRADPDGVPEDTDDPDGAARLQRSVMALTLRLTDHSAVIGDDLHYCDDATTELLTRLSAPSSAPGGARGAPPTVMCYRQGDLAPHHEAALARLLDAGQAVRIEVGPLDTAGVHALLDSLNVPPGHALDPGVARLAGGNPLLVLEAARYLLDVATGEAPPDLPLRLEQLLTRRVERLSAAALPAARAASVLQRDFTPELVAAMLGRPLLETAAAWEELERAEIVVGERFSHDLVAEALLGHMPAVVRRLLHRAAARVLGEAGADPARVAQQWLGGGDDLEAAPWLVRAGRGARRAFRRREAADVLARAAEIYTRHGQPDAAFDAATLHLGVLADLDDPAHRPAAEALLARARDDGQRARASVQLARALSQTADGAALADAVTAGLGYARAAGDVASEAELQEARAIVALWACQLDDALAPLQRMQEIGEQTGSLDLQARAEEDLGLWASYRDLPRAAAHLVRAEALNLQRGARERAASSADKLARVQYELGDVRAAQAIHDRSAGLLATLDGSEGEKLSNVYGRALCQLALGDPGAALALCDHTLATSAASGNGNLGAVAVGRARTLAQLGRFGAALAALEDTRRWPTFAGHHAGTRAIEQAAVLTAQNRPAEAGACLDEAQARLATLDDAYLRVRLLLGRAALLSPERALDVLDGALDLARQHGLDGAVTAVLARRASALLSLGHLPPLPEPREPHGGVITAEEWHLTAYLSLRAAGAPGAGDHLRAARQGLDAAARTVPDALRAAYLSAVPVNRAIRAEGHGG